MKQSFVPVPPCCLAGTDGAQHCREVKAEQPRSAAPRIAAPRTALGPAGRGSGGAWAGGWRQEPSAGAGGATHAGGGLAARCSPAPQSLKAPFSRSAGSSPEEAEAT